MLWFAEAIYFSRLKRLKNKEATFVHFVLYTACIVYVVRTGIDVLYSIRPRYRLLGQPVTHYHFCYSCTFISTLESHDSTVLFVPQLKQLRNLSITWLLAAQVRTVTADLYRYIYLLKLMHAHQCRKKAHKRLRGTSTSSRAEMNTCAEIVDLFSRRKVD